MSWLHLPFSSFVGVWLRHLHCQPQHALLGLCYLLLYTAAVLTLWSMVAYLRAAAHVIRAREGMS